MTIREENRDILSKFRQDVDLAWSEVIDKVHTVEEYQKALTGIEDHYIDLILNIVATSVDGLEITEDRHFDPPKDGLITIYKDGSWAKSYNQALKDVKEMLGNLEGSSDEK